MSQTIRPSFHLAPTTIGSKNPRMNTAVMTVDLGAIANNWLALDQYSGNNTRTGAVVKADSYGLGADVVAKYLFKKGVDTFFVAQTNEGVSLRHAIGNGPQINVFAGHMAGDAPLLEQHNLTPMLNSVGQIQRHLSALPDRLFGIQLDTGMNRLGLEPKEWANHRDMVMRKKPTLLMSHLACADEPANKMNVQQLEQFHQMTDGLKVPRSLAATGGVLLGADYHFDLTRPGIGLFGGQPFAQAKPVVTLSLPVIQVRDILGGETVGYGNAWTATGPCRIATLSAGYADGLLRAFGLGMQLFHQGIPCPLAGRISMDLITVDVSGLDTVPEQLDAICTEQTIDQLAKAGDTIGYEVLTGLGPRYTRRYKTP